MNRVLMVTVLALAGMGVHAMEKGDEAPNFEFEHAWNTLPGAKQLTDYRGRIVFLEIWKIH